MRYTVTDAGKLEHLVMRVGKVRPLPTRGMTIVVFDIPEKWRKCRYRIRYFLTLCGFTRLQKSVWVSEKPCEEDILEAARILRATQWVKVFVGQKCP
jgi:DNA-binding transcriptional regulator PaaX